MIRQSTIDKLHDMRLSAMSDAFECQCKDPDTYQGLSFEDRFGMLRFPGKTGRMTPETLTLRRFSTIIYIKY